MSVRCDCGSNFVGAKAELEKRMSSNSRRLSFVFNPPHSSHMGGVWERQIRSVRNVLAGILAGCPGRLDTSTLRTFLYEAAYIINSRPLCAADGEDPSVVAITPDMLLHAKTDVLLPLPGDFESREVCGRKRWR